MKPSSAPRKNKRVTARNAGLLNLLAWPGLGSLFAGRRMAGTGQLLIFLAGFLLFCGWALRNIYNYYHLMLDETPPAPSATGRVLVVSGLALCAISWLWSLATSVSLSRAAADTRVDELKNFSAGLLKLDEEKIISALAALPGWTRTGEVISRTFVFKDFPAAMKFVNAVADNAERVQHHPDVDIRWNKVTLALTTHDAGGLTEKDFALARACETLAKL